MIITVCSQKTAVELVRKAEEKTAVISITSLESPDVIFPENPNIESILHLKFNDLTEEYDEEGIPYGRPLPKQGDFSGLKDFVTNLPCENLIVHCWEGASRSAAVAKAIFVFRGNRDTVRSQKTFRPNPLVYELACRELGIKQFPVFI